MVLGQQLGKTNIVAWASQEEEEMDASVSTMSKDHPAESVTEARAVAWEEAEKLKYLARYPCANRHHVACGAFSSLVAKGNGYMKLLS